MTPLVTNFRDKNLLSAFVEQSDDKQDLKLVTSAILDILSGFQSKKTASFTKAKKKARKQIYNVLIQNLHNILTSNCFSGKQTEGKSPWAKYLGIADLKPLEEEDEKKESKAGCFPVLFKKKDEKPISDK